MDSERGTEGTASGHARVLLVGCCLLAVVLAATLVPALTAGAGSPAESLLPGAALAGAGGGGELPDAGGFGTLNPGDVTDAGGDPGVSDSIFRSQNATVHFTVRSSAPAYWRTASYGVYTGTGWRRSGDTTPYSGPIETGGVAGQRVDYEVRLNRTATAVPTVWRPRTVEGVDGLEVTDGRAVGTDAPLASGTTYAGSSEAPPRTPEVLEASGRDYPEAVEERYARVSANASRRIGEFTDELAADADTPYETARRIEYWLESEKEYSLNVSQNSDDMVERFVFRMDRGYCEYFASAMVVMLRTQDVPARYVVGYSTGQQVAEDTYRVRAMNAHAWVEVYFEDIGWVKFDPTPGSARLQQERQSLQAEQPGESYAPRERGSPGETFSPDSEERPAPPPTATPVAEPTTEAEPGRPGGETGGNPTPGPAEETPTADGDAGGSYDVYLNRTAVPGATVKVTVVRGGEPAVDRTVSFNGEPVGTTGADGTTTGTVPYADELRINVTGGPPGLAALADRESLGADRRGRLRRPSPAPRNVTVPVATNATIAVAGETVPGGTVTVTATVEGVPVERGTVTLDGRQVGTTDADGRARVALPAEPGNYTLAVERGPVRGETAVALPALELSVTPQAPLALPLTGATVEVTAGDRPLGGVPVRVDGRRVATTGYDGTATVVLPLAGDAAVSVTTRGATQTRTVTGLVANLLLVLAGLAAAVGGPFAVLVRRGYGPRDLLRGLITLPGWLATAARRFLVALATRGDELLAGALARLRATAGHLRDLATGAATLADLRAKLLAWLRAKRRGHREDRPDGGSEGGDVDDARRGIRAAWNRFLGYVSVGSERTRTPGEVARHAVRRDGLPAEPVRTLRDAVREVEYGGRPAADRLDSAREALAAIERRTADGDANADGDRETVSREGEN